METKVGCITRSKAQASAGTGRPEEACVTVAPPRSEANPTLRSHSSRSSREAARLRAEYEAEKEIARVHEQLIKKKLALEIAEINDEYGDADYGVRSVVSEGEKLEKVTRWLGTKSAGGTTQHVAEHSPAGEATCPDTQRKIPLTHAPPERPATLVTALDTRPGARGDVAPPSPASDIKHLANAIMAMSKQRYDLPEFDGNPVDWLSYKRAFENTAAHYTLYQNIVRLQKSLRGPAKRAVEALLSTGSAPEDVLDALEEEFGHPNLLLESAIRKIRNLPLVSDNGAELRHMTSVVRNCVYILKNIKAEGYINNPQITQEILGKLSPIQRSRYGEFVMKMDSSGRVEDLRISPNLNIVLEFLSYLSKASSYYLPLSVTDPPRRNVAPREKISPAQHRDRRDTHGVHATADISPDESSSSGITISSNNQCALCDKYHSLPECRVFIDKSSDQKWDFVKQNKLCFKCLVKQHSRFQCQAKRCTHCRASHHELLHFNSRAPVDTSTETGSRVYPKSDNASGRPRPAAARATRAAPESAAGPPPAPRAALDTARAAAPRYGSRAADGRQPLGSAVCYDAESVTSVSGELCTKSLLKVLPVIITMNNVDRACYALLDDGATVSLIDSSLCVKANGVKLPLKIISASGHIVTDHDSCRVTALITGPNGVRHNIALRTMQNVDLPPQNVPARVLEQNAHLRDLDHCAMSWVKPTVLIGQDNWDLIVNHEIRQGKSGQPVASLTKLGWVVHGPLGIPESTPDSVNFVAEKCDDLYELVRQQFELESLGILETSRKNIEHDRAYEILERTSRRVDGGWEVGLLWARDDVHLPDNYNSALKRLRMIENKMDKNPDYAATYERQIERLVKEKYAVKVKEPMHVSPVWWLPHFGVTNPNKPGKLRLVFDAAAKSQNTCLNDHLLAGPDLLNSLLGALFKFRIGPIAFTADIADFFMRIKIRKEDRGAQLFLWRGKDRTRDPEPYVMDSIIFGAKSSPSSANFVLRKNAREFNDTHPEAVEAINCKHYMDDYLDSVQSVDTARQLIQDVSMIHAAGGFDILGWVSNSPELRRELPSVVAGAVNLDKSPSSNERTLGMIWVPESDELAFDLSFKKLPPEIVEGRAIPTKRDFLRFVMSIFDPLGILSSYTIKSKILLQAIWRSGIGWDQQLKEKDFKEWPVNEFQDAANVDSERLEKVHVVKQHESLIDVSRFSSWIRALRVAARVLAFVGMCRKRQAKEITGQNIRDAELLLIRQAQSESYSEEIKSLKTGSTLPVKSYIRNLDPFVYEDESIALTPNHLLLGTASGASTLGSFDASDLNGRKAWRKAQALADMFWRRWLKEYVPTLQRRQKWLNETRPIKVGDVVLILDEKQPRNMWPRGVVSAVHPGRDGHIRIATIKTCKGSVTRPVVKLAVLPTHVV